MDKANGGLTKYEYEMGGVKLESVHCVRDLGVTIKSNLKFSQHCKEVACKPYRMLGFINRNFSFKNKNRILSMYINLVRSHLENAVQFWSPHHAKDIAKLEAVQRRATKMIPSLRNKSYEERLALLNLFSLEQGFSKWGSRTPRGPWHFDRGSAKFNEINGGCSRFP